MRRQSVLKRFATALRGRRKTLGLTQEIAAERCRIGVRYWRDIEAGTRSLSLGVADRIVGLGLSWSDALDDAPLNAAPASARDAFDTAWLALDASRAAGAGCDASRAHAEAVSGPRQRCADHEKEGFHMHCGGTNILGPAGSRRVRERERFRTRWRPSMSDRCGSLRRSWRWCTDTTHTASYWPCYCCHTPPSQAP